MTSLHNELSKTENIAQVILKLKSDFYTRNYVSDLTCNCGIKESFFCVWWCLDVQSISLIIALIKYSPSEKWLYVGIQMYWSISVNMHCFYTEHKFNSFTFWTIFVGRYQWTPLLVIDKRPQAALNLKARFQNNMPSLESFCQNTCLNGVSHFPVFRLELR